MYIDLGRGGGVLPIMGYTGRLHLKGEPFSGFRYSEREGISLVEIYKRLGNSNPLFHSVRGLLKLINNSLRKYKGN